MLKEEEKQELQAYQAKLVMLDEKKDMDGFYLIFFS